MTFPKKNGKSKKSMVPNHQPDMYYLRCGTQKIVFFSAFDFVRAKTVTAVETTVPPIAGWFIMEHPIEMDELLGLSYSF